VDLLQIITIIIMYMGWSNREEIDGRGKQHVWEQEDVYIGLWWGNLWKETIWKTQV
jgi:hypothetical protein